MEPGSLSREAILGARDLPEEVVTVAEWGGTVRVRGLDGTDRDAYEASTIRVEGGKVRMDYTNVRARLVALSVVDAAGARVFTDADIPALAKKSGLALQRVWTVARRLSGLDGTEDLEGNSDAAPAAASPSSLPGPSGG